jgi:hypothetical protein
MNSCNCGTLELLNGDQASNYSKEHLHKISHHGGWIQLWKCSDNEIYCEGTWIGGAGFDNGKFTLTKITYAELKSKWPEAIK